MGWGLLSPRSIKLDDWVNGLMGSWVNGLGQFHLARMIGLMG